VSVGQQGCMYGRCNICVASSDHVSPFFLNAKSTGREKHDQRYRRYVCQT